MKPVNRCECISTSIKGDGEEGTYVEGNTGIIEGHGMIEDRMKVEYKNHKIIYSHVC